MNWSNSSFHLFFYAFVRKAEEFLFLSQACFFPWNVKYLYRVITFNLSFSGNSWNPPLETLFFSAWPFLHEYLLSFLWTLSSWLYSFLETRIQGWEREISPLCNLLSISLRVSIVIWLVFFFLIRTVLWKFMLKLKTNFDMYQFKI